MVSRRMVVAAVSLGLVIAAMPGYASQGGTPYRSSATSGSCDQIASIGSCSWEANADVATGATHVRVSAEPGYQGANVAVYQHGYARAELATTATIAGASSRVRFKVTFVIDSAITVCEDQVDPDSQTRCAAWISATAQAAHTECECTATWSDVLVGNAFYNPEAGRPFYLTLTNPSGGNLPEGEVKLTLGVEADMSALLIPMVATVYEPRIVADANIRALVERVS